MQLPPVARADEEMPVCIAGYADGPNVTNRVPPAMTGPRRSNSIPVRIIIDRRGRVRHTHIVSAFPEQAESIMAALAQWTFKPHEVNGQRVEVETGIWFGYTPARPGGEDALKYLCLAYGAEEDWIAVSNSRSRAPVLTNMPRPRFISTRSSSTSCW